MSCDELKMPTREKIAHNDVRAKELISDSQWETLCVTFRKLGLTEDVGMSGDRTSIMFWYEVSGLVTGGKVSGIIYSEEALSPLIADLDTVSASGRYYSKLDRPNWYLLRWID